MIALTEEQERELRRYAHGRPRHPATRPNTNLVRRNLLMSVRAPSDASERHGWYLLTEHGRAALSERQSPSFLDGDDTAGTADHNRRA